MNAFLTLLALLVLVFSVEALAQAPEPTTEDLRRQMAEITAEVADARAEVKALIADKVKADNLKLRNEKLRLQKELAARRRLTTLVAEYGKTGMKVQNLQAAMIDESDKVDIALLIKHRDELAALIAKANRTFACRVLRLGCVGRK